MAVSEFALALCALLGTLLVPFFVLYQMLRLKRRAIRVAAQPAPEVTSASHAVRYINPHKGRPKWQGYAVLTVLLLLTAAVVAAALARV